jgi:site-specific DNA recombinase
MGRLTLNVLLSFAQFERELAGERIRDKVAASKARGLWMGGWAPLGYDVENRRLVVNETEAALVRHLYQRFLKLGSVTSLVRELTSEGVRTKRGRPFDKGQIYRLLRNPLYRGEVVHKGTHHPGQHEAIVTPTLFEQVQAVLQESPRSRAATTRARTPSLLKGLLVGADGRAYSPSHTRRRGRLYRYYVSQAVLKGGPLPPGPTRLPAGEIEAAVVQELRSLVAAPEMVVRTWRAARIQDPSIGEDEVRTALTAFDQLWDELFPSEQARLVQLLVERVTVGESGLTLTLRTEGLTSLVGELRAPPVTAEAA